MLSTHDAQCIEEGRIGVIECLNKNTFPYFRRYCRRMEKIEVDWGLSYVGVCVYININVSFP